MATTPTIRLYLIALDAETDQLERTSFEGDGDNSRAHVSRKHTQQEAVARRHGRRGPKQPISVLEQILGRKGVPVQRSLFYSYCQGLTDPVTVHSTDFSTMLKFATKAVARASNDAVSSHQALFLEGEPSAQVAIIGAGGCGGYCLPLQAARQCPFPTFFIAIAPPSPSPLPGKLRREGCGNCCHSVLFVSPESSGCNQTWGGSMHCASASAEHAARPKDDASDCTPPVAFAPDELLLRIHVHRCAESRPPPLHAPTLGVLIDGETEVCAT